MPRGIVALVGLGLGLSFRFLISDTIPFLGLRTQIWAPGGLRHPLVGRGLDFGDRFFLRGLAFHRNLRYGDGWRRVLTADLLGFGLLAIGQKCDDEFTFSRVHNITRCGGILKEHAPLSMNE